MTKRLIRNVSSTFYDEFRVPNEAFRSKRGETEVFINPKREVFSAFEAKLERRLCRWWKASGERSASSRPRAAGVPLAPAEQGLSGAPAARQGFPRAVGSAATPTCAASSSMARGAAPAGATGHARSGWADTNEKSARGLWDLAWQGSDGLSSLHVRAQPHPQCSRSAGKIASLMFAPPEDGDVVSREHWKEHAVSL